MPHRNDSDGTGRGKGGGVSTGPMVRSRAPMAVRALDIESEVTAILHARTGGPTALIAVALIENNRMVRDGMTALLRESADFTVESSEASGCRPMLARSQPNVILMDVGLWADGAHNLAQLVTTEYPLAGVVITDMLPKNEELITYVNDGVCGFTLKDATREELVATVRTVAAGDHVLPPAMTSTLFSQIAKEALVRGRAVAGSTVRMTSREKEVIGLIGEGLSNKEIAARLTIATHTVKSHVRNVMEKLALHTRLQIAAFAHGRPH